jgi:RNA polymerase sigma-70 factor (ECF subfamily)
LLIAAETDANLKAKMWRAINELTPMQREIISLKFFEELNYDAIAVMLKLKPRTVYNHMHAAISALRDELSSK